jgi:hypothetical protein
VYVPTGRDDDVFTVTETLVVVLELIVWQLLGSVEVLSPELSSPSTPTNS